MVLKLSKFVTLTSESKLKVDLLIVHLFFNIQYHIYLHSICEVMMMVISFNKYTNF